MNSINKEKTIVSNMIYLYCKDKHSIIKDLCEDCEGLKNYSISKLNNCRYSNKKPVCKKCNTHCYNPTMKEKIKNVMRYSGPRMLFLHPLNTVYYLLKNIR